MEISRVCIVGLGLIGGSIAKALRNAQPTMTIIGIDSDQDTLDLAKSEGVINRGFTQIDFNIENSQFVIICLPIHLVMNCVLELKKVVMPDCIISDTASVKEKLISQIEELDSSFNFIGGHPMCGSEKKGYKNSSPDFFNNAYYIMIPGTKTNHGTINIMESIIRMMGSIPIMLDASVHDKVTGAISHVPHVVSAALVNSVAQASNHQNEMKKLAAGGFKDITRISSANPSMFKTIVMENKQHVKEMLNLFKNNIEQFIDLLDKEDEENIYNFFESAKKYRDSF
jgi:prephenate dehydrogenase